MADFCNQCAAAMGDPLRQLAGITSKKEWEELKAVVVLCEGCGAIQVDPEGNCVTTNCLENHGDPNIPFNQQQIVGPT